MNPYSNLYPKKGSASIIEQIEVINETIKSLEKKKELLKREIRTKSFFLVMFSDNCYPIEAHSEQEAIILAQASQIKLGKPYACPMVLEKEEN